MESSTKLQDIDLKIKELQEKKKQLEQKHLTELAKFLKRTEAHTLNHNLLIGAILEIVHSAKTGDKKVEDWKRKGEEFLKKFSKTKGGEGDTSSFRESSK